MRKIVPDDINIDFMGARKKAFIGSGIAVLVSVLSVVIFGFNLGIDFRGGAEIIASFERGAISDRGDIRAAMEAFVAQELGQEGTQVEVQDFSAGAGDEFTRCETTTAEDGEVTRSCETIPVDRYSIYIEVSSLISIERRDEIIQKLREAFGEETRIDSRDDADTFYLNFPAEVPILEREAELAAVFAEVGYPEVTVTSDYERQLELEFLRDQELMRQDAEAAARATGASIEGAMAAPTLEEYEARKRQELEGRVDNRFTVHVMELSNKLAATLDGAFPGKFVAVENTMTVSPSVGADLFANGMLAILYAMVGILIYITVRFDFRFAPGAVAAITHDIIITLGIFALLQVKFSLPIIAALLTIVGYSLNDTIVVMDRVRETFDEYRGRSITALLNKGINSTLSRTVLTSGTTLLVVISILVFGGGQISDFALALLIGVIVGTYSSVFIASPLVEYMDTFIKRREAQAKAALKSGGGNNPEGGGRKAKATA